MMMMMMMRGKSGGWVVVASRYFIPGLILEYEIIIQILYSRHLDSQATIHTVLPLAVLNISSRVSLQETV